MGHTEFWPFIIERGATNDNQFLERFQDLRARWRKEWGAHPPQTLDGK